MFVSFGIWGLFLVLSVSLNASSGETLFIPFLINDKFLVSANHTENRNTS